MNMYSRHVLNRIYFQYIYSILYIVYITCLKLIFSTHIFHRIYFKYAFSILYIFQILALYTLYVLQTTFEVVVVDKNEMIFYVNTEYIAVDAII